MVVGGIDLVTSMLELGQESPALRIKMGYVYLAVPVSGCFLTLYAVIGLVERLARGGPAPLRSVRNRTLGGTSCESAHRGSDHRRRYSSVAECAGGILPDWFTPTEGAAVVVLYSFILVASDNPFRLALYTGVDSVIIRF